MIDRAEFQLTADQQADLEAIFAHVSEERSRDAAQNPKECLDALLSTLREKLSNRMDANMTLSFAILFASHKRLPKRPKRKRAQRAT